MDIEEIYDFLEQSQGINRSQLSPKSDLCKDLGIEGDDFFELEEAFAEKYSVDMNSYRWYFHHGEEGWNLGSLFFPAPYNQVAHIPVTPEVLLQAATTRVWPLNYPEHEITSRRGETIINNVILFLLVGFFVLCVIYNIT